jgi:hypothetical protein
MLAWAAPNALTDTFGLAFIMARASSLKPSRPIKTITSTNPNPYKSALDTMRTPLGWADIPCLGDGLGLGFFYRHFIRHINLPSLFHKIIPQDQTKMKSAWTRQNREANVIGISARVAMHGH